MKVLSRPARPDFLARLSLVPVGESAGGEVLLEQVRTSAGFGWPLWDATDEELTARCSEGQRTAVRLTYELM